MNTDLSLILAGLQVEFLAELPERCDRLESRLMALERSESGAFDELYRQVHSLKGTGGTYGIPIITTICHHFENFIAEAHQPFDHDAVRISLTFVDLLRQTVQPEGRSPAGAAKIEETLQHLHLSNLKGRASVLVVEASAAMQRLFHGAIAAPSVQVTTLNSGLAALERLLREPFDLMVASLELPDLNAVALTAAIRESCSCNAEIPVILVSSNELRVPDYLHIRAQLNWDPTLSERLEEVVAETLGLGTVHAR